MEPSDPKPEQWLYVKVTIGKASVSSTARCTGNTTNVVMSVVKVKDILGSGSWSTW